MTMRAALLSLVTLLSAGADGGAASDTPGVDTARCKVAIGDLARTSGAQPDHRSPSGDNMFMGHRAAKTIVMSCAPYGPLSVSLNFDGAFPPAPFYDLVAEAGVAVTGERRADLLRKAIECQKTALISADESASLNTARASLECRAFTRDGGGTLIQVYPRRSESTE